MKTAAPLLGFVMVCGCMGETNSVVGAWLYNVGQQRREIRFTPQGHFDEFIPSEGYTLHVEGDYSLMGTTLTINPKAQAAENVKPGQHPAVPSIMEPKRVGTVAMEGDSVFIFSSNQVRTRYDRKP